MYIPVKLLSGKRTLLNVDQVSFFEDGEGDIMVSFTDGSFLYIVDTYEELQAALTNNGRLVKWA